jgi:hypothetical protein
MYRAAVTLSVLCLPYTGLCKYYVMVIIPSDFVERKGSDLKNGTASRSIFIFYLLQFIQHSLNAPRLGGGFTNTASVTEG